MGVSLELDEKRAKQAAYMREWRKANPAKARANDRVQDRRKRDRDPEGFRARARERTRRYRLKPDKAEQGREAARRWREKQPVAYRSWAGMLDRCYRSGHPRWSDYGGRGITVCDRWRESFAHFFADMGERPNWADGGLDRIDNDGNYEPGNCRWATRSQQSRNRRNVTP